ncbi:hypothetical protein BKH44_02560 [Helicobacter sp. 13S00477-4]|nr:hypothetical protein BKH44_02560 [Helicobacter sp. 13S00477-4]
MQRDEILRLLYRRYSCRDFDKNKKIQKEDFELILESGRLAPSSLGLEPWEFIVVTSQNIKNKIAQDSSGNHNQIQNCSHLLIVCNLITELIAPESNYLKTLYKDNETFLAIQSMFHSICNNRLNGDEKLINAYLREQCFISIGQMTQVAALMDIDSCIIGGFYAKGLKKLLDTFMSVDRIEPVCLIAFGYSMKCIASSKHRKPYEDTVKWL